MGILKDILYQRLASEQRDVDREDNRIQAEIYNVEKEKNDLLAKPQVIDALLAWT